MPELTANSQHYNAVLAWNITSGCNLDCAYCIAKIEKMERKASKINSFIKKIVKLSKLNIVALIKYLNFRFFKEKKGKIPRIDIPALMKTLDETGKIFRIAFTGGEPFMVPNITEACIEITKKHFISFNTNLTTGSIKKFTEHIDPKRVIFVRASLHIKELERLGLINKYIDNFFEYKRKSFNIFAVQVAYPPLINEEEKYKHFFQEKGINITYIPFKGNYNGKHYPGSYTLEEIKTFGLDVSCCDVLNLKGKICNAGYNIVAALQNGIIVQCFTIYKEMGHIYKKIKFNNKLTLCTVCYCGCPFYKYDQALFAIADAHFKNMAN